MKIFLTLALFCSAVFAQTKLEELKANYRAQSASCIVAKCHADIEASQNIHKSQSVRIGCVFCHGGDAQAREADVAHAGNKGQRAKSKGQRLYAEWLKLDYATVKHLNPGDLRVADETCGPCHASEVLRVKKSMMATSALLWGGASYNNGILPNKNYLLGEAYTPLKIDDRESKMVGAKINQWPQYSANQMKRFGVRDFLLPLPRWEVMQPGDNFRSFERGGLIDRINPSNIGIPNPLNLPGKPDNKLSDRGLGTQLYISSPVLNLHKTRLNDPHLWLPGTNDKPGDYRASGCTACHIIYANDRSRIAAGPWAERQHAKSQQSNTPAIQQSNQPLIHQFTTAIPTSQCMTCHMHQPNGFLNTYLGFQMWDYETEGKWFYPRARGKSDRELLEFNPEEAVLRGKWGDDDFLRDVSKLNAQMTNGQFADYHGHGWNFRAVFKKDRKGNLLDKDGKIIPENSPHKFHGLQTLTGNPRCAKPECATTQKAVHLVDIHAERGLHCVDCHFERDSHGNGNLYGEFHNAVEIQCQDCHGDFEASATLRTSGVPTRLVGNTRLDDLGKGKTPFGERRFIKRGDAITQRSMLYENVVWQVPQIVLTQNEKARRAHFQKNADGELAHAAQKMDCASCHNSWITNCFGCHLPQQANWMQKSKHYEGETTRNWTSYNPQVLRDDALILCVGPTTDGNKISPARSSSALMLSSRNADREQIYNQQAPISSAGFSSQAFNSHAPHTVRKTETRGCTDCHLSEANDNNAWLAATYLQGTNFVNFIGKYAYVATGEHGVEAVKVTEDAEPQAVIGSYLHRLAFNEKYSDKNKQSEKLETSHHHSGLVNDVAVRGEYLYAACGPEGLRVFDVANIDNKGFSERIVTAPVSSRGQNTQVKTANAVAVVLPTTQPIDYDQNLWIRTNYPENQERRLHELYRYVYVVDKEEGLILVDVGVLADRDPENNFLTRTMLEISDTPQKKSARIPAKGANTLAIAGVNFYIAAQEGVLLYNLDTPTRPRLRATLRGLRNPKSIAVQFRYAFVLDDEGLHVLDITSPEQMRLVPNNTIKLREAYSVTLARTYAYVAAGRDGLVIVDIENPERIRIAQKLNLNPEGENDVRRIEITAAYAGIFGYVADGVNGFKVLQLTSPESQDYLGFSPRPRPRVIAWKKTHSPALAIAKGIERDRAVDESGNQISVFGRLGSRPMTLEEQKKLYEKGGRGWRVKE